MSFSVKRSKTPKRPPKKVSVASVFRKPASGIMLPKTDMRRPLSKRLILWRP